MNLRQFLRLRSHRLAASCFAALAFACHVRAADTATNRFGFSGPEIFPIAPQIAGLNAADLDGDGLVDLIIADNTHSKIALLYNQTGKTNLTRRASSAKREMNELPFDARFRLESIASEKRISSITVTDLNGDGRPDIAYYGDPKELVVLYNLGAKGWSQPKRIPIDDGQLTPGALTHGDLNGDKLTDLVLLAENHVWLIAQKPDHTLAEPQKIPFTGSIKAAQVVDIDGDGRDDLLLVNWDNAIPFRFRLQNSAGQLGPEIHLSYPPIRAYWADDLDGDHKTEIITIALNSGRAQISNFIQKSAEPLLGALKLGQFQITPLGKTDKSRRGAAWADVNGDQLADLIVAEPDSGQLAIFLQNADGRQVGVTRMEPNGRIAFPKIIPVDGKPLALAAGALKPGAKPSLAVIVDQDGRRVLQLHSADGTRRVQKLAESYKSNPSALAFHDANQDGLVDLVVFTPYEKIKILMQVPDKEFEEVDVTPPGGAIEQPWFSTADVDGDGKPELLLAQKNFVRAVVLAPEAKPAGADAKSSWAFTVKEQINGAASNSRIVATTALRSGTNSLIFLLDAERKALSVCERDASGVWRIAKNVPLPVTDFTALAAVPSGAGRPPALGFLGLNSAAILALQGNVWDIQELDGYETPIKDGRLADVVTGDLNQDGRKDLVFLETAKNHIDIVTFDPPHKLTPSNRWQVFEERTFRSRRSDLPEPREAVIADVKKKKKNDLKPNRAFHAPKCRFASAGLEQHIDAGPSVFRAHCVVSRSSNVARGRLAAVARTEPRRRVERDGHPATIPVERFEYPLARPGWRRILFSRHRPGSRLPH
ncbi:MAG: VCBS repeat-containing protein [Verrucomicrobia bacterium]|nr:VCBS repeat-containing protein [Verrucomicrobiota bacterium]